MDREQLASGVFIVGLVVVVVVNETTPNGFWALLVWFVVLGLVLLR